MSDYKPTTEVIRRRATEPRYEGYDRRKRVVRDLERDFDAWLAEHDTQVRAETWDEAIQAVFDWWSTPDDERGVIVNPHGVHPADRLMQEIEKEAGL